MDHVNGVSEIMSEKKYHPCGRLSFGGAPSL